MSDAYAIVDIPKSLPIHGMALTSTGRKIEHNKVVLGTQTYFYVDEGVFEIYITNYYLLYRIFLNKMGSFWFTTVR